MRRISRLLPLLFTISILVNCATTGPGGKTSLIFIGSETEVSIGREMDASIRLENRILDDSLWQKYVNDVGQKIVAVCDRKDIEYHFAVIDSNIVNAFAAPGGYLFFYTGLLKIMENEAEMAAVIAHEVSHVVARHSIKRLQAAMGVALLEQLVLGQSADAVKAAVDIGLGLSFASYSRANEIEADNFGVQYMLKAGYNPEASITMFEKLASMSQGEPDFFEKLSMSHPETQERIQRSKDLIQSLRPLPENLILGAEKYRSMKARIR
jgi:predicted Zn-dependent protease